MIDKTFSPKRKEQSPSKRRRSKKKKKRKAPAPVIIPQDDLTGIIFQRGVQHAHLQLRKKLVGGLEDKTPVEPGELQMAIEPTPYDGLSYGYVRRFLTHDEARSVWDETAESIQSVLHIRNVSYFECYCPDPIKDGKISQSVLRLFLWQVDICRGLKEHRQILMDLLRGGATVKEGHRNAWIVNTKDKEFTRADYEKVLGKQRVEEVVERLRKVLLLRLVIRDSEGNALGWHRECEHDLHTMQKEESYASQNVKSFRGY